MSRIAVQGNASGTGTLTIAAPNTSTDRTLTLPDNTGTILTNATTAGFPAGSVLQVVEATDSTDRATSSSSYVDAGISVTITPQSTSNKILLIWNFNGSAYDAGANAASSRFVITDSSNNIIGGQTRFQANPTFQVDSPLSIIRYASPATTSAVTYKGRFRTDYGSTADIYNAFTGSGHLFAIEVAA